MDFNGVFKGALCSLICSPTSVPICWLEVCVWGGGEQHSVLGTIYARDTLYSFLKDVSDYASPVAHPIKSRQTCGAEDALVSVPGHSHDLIFPWIQKCRIRLIIALSTAGLGPHCNCHSILTCMALFVLCDAAQSGWCDNTHSRKWQQINRT